MADPASQKIVVGLDGSQWGNYPQTYSHVGLINAVFRIAKKIDLPTYSVLKRPS